VACARALGNELLKELDIALKAADTSVEQAFARADFDAGHVLRRRPKHGRQQQDGKSCNLWRDLASHGRLQVG
jgi:hypothetical protein